MNAKKIMGAVLVALLAAALFVGAGAAAITADKDGSTVFVNQKLPVANYSGNWVGPNGAYTPAFVPGDNTHVYFGVAGTYTAKVDEKTVTINVKAPEVSVVGVADGDKYTFIPGNLYQGTGAKVYVNGPAGLTYDLYYWGGKETGLSGQKIITLTGSEVLGEYTIQAEFTAGQFIPGTTPEQLITEKVTFSIVDPETAVSISAAETTVLKTEAIKLTVTGQPGELYAVTFDTDYAFTVPADQIGFTTHTNDAKTGVTFYMPAGGKATFDVIANTTTKLESSEKIFAKAVNIDNAKRASVTINFMKGTISAKADASSYFVGDTITITGTSSAGAIKTITIEGTNFKTGNLFAQAGNPGLDADNAFEFELDTDNVKDEFKKLDVGTYTLTIETDNGAETIVALVLKQPFISIAEAPEVVVQGKDAKFVVNAEATTEIGYYVFGTNYFYYDTTNANVEDEDGQAILNMFKFKIDKDITANLSLGQYFVVVQHPMYDGKFQIVSGYPTNWTILGANGAEDFITPIDVKTRQTANAAQALCDALDIQGIDDMYVKASFFIVGEDATSTMSELPTEVVKGETIVISGVDTALEEGTVVTAQMLSTAFAAVPKETVGSAAFIVVSTKVAEDGTWELTLDTSDLNVDEYSLSVAIDNVPKKTVTVNVVEAKPDTPVTPDTPDTPVTPDTPDEPVAPATPGFGALAALAGLGAVAVLLLRRE